MAVDPKSRETRQRLEKCWTLELNWKPYPEPLRKGCFQISKSLCVPPVAVIGGLVTLTSYMVSPAVVKVPSTEWSERALVWLSINMPTGSTKSALYQYLHNIVIRVRGTCGYTSRDPAWLVGDSTCEKMGDLMATNGGRLLGLYDELATFLTQLNVYRGKGLALSHELALFLQLYNGHSWTRATVTGEANFSMESTCLTVGGFSQPCVARSLIEQSGSAEIGLSQRFLWLFPQPSYCRFNTLEGVDKQFSDALVDLLQKQWTPGRTQKPHPRVFTMREDSKAFADHFDQVQEQLEKLNIFLFTLGVLSKSKGQILRVATALHVLFHVGSSDSVNEELGDKAIAAAIDFVELCCQQTAFMAGRGDIKEEIQIIKASISDETEQPPESTNTPGYCLKLPGRKLNLTALLYAKKFRNHGYKSGALAAFDELEADGLGKVEIKQTKSAKQHIFTKAEIPLDAEGKTQFAKKLMKYSVSLLEYSRTLAEEEIVSPKVKAGSKRPATPPATALSTPTKQLRRSPRKPSSPPSTPQQEQ